MGRYTYRNLIFAVASHPFNFWLLRCSVFHKEKLTIIFYVCSSFEPIGCMVCGPQLLGSEYLVGWNVP